MLYQLPNERDRPVRGIGCDLAKVENARASAVLVKVELRDHVSVAVDTDYARDMAVGCPTLNVAEHHDVADLRVGRGPDAAVAMVVDAVRRVGPAAGVGSPCVDVVQDGSAVGNVEKPPEVAV